MAGGTGNVHASWVDADGLMHPVGHLDELGTAYKHELTLSLEFGAFGEGLLTSNFLYAPGASPPTGGAMVSGSPDAVDAAISAVRRAFPLPVGGGVIFLSWSGDVSLAIARTLKEILDRRLGAGSNVFLSELSIAPGENPGEVMLERNLRRADALVAVLTEHAAQSPWVIWETAAVWGRRKLLIPIFVDTRPGLVPGPLGQVVQGIKLHQRERLDIALDALADAAGKPATDPLTDEEFDALVVAARMIPGRIGGGTIVRLEHRGSQTEIGELTIAAPIVEGVSGATEVMRQIDEAVESELSAFDAQQQVAAAMMSDEAAGPVANYADIRWTPTLVTEKLISFLVEGSYVWPGKVTSYQQSAGFVFDASTGGRLTTSDVFVEETGWRDALEQLFIAKSKEITGIDDWNIALPDPPSFTITDTSFGIATSRYEIGPGALGAPTVWIPNVDLDRYYRPNFRRLLVGENSPSA